MATSRIVLPTWDGRRCQWKLAGGEICGCTTRLEFAHLEARADGGLPTIDNLRLLCRFHNQYEARRRFGDALVDRVARKDSKLARARRAPAAPRSTQPSLDL